MNYPQFKKVRALVAAFVSAVVAAAVVADNILLALSGVIIGMLFLFLVKKKAKIILVDEMVQDISGKAARLTYVIFTIVIALSSLVFIMSGRRTGQSDYEIIGVILSYAALFSVALYSLSYKFFSKKYGEDHDEQD